MGFRSSDTGRLLFAVVPDAVAAERIYRLAMALKRARGFDGKLVEEDRLHVTLFSLELSEHAVRMASEAAAEVSVQPFDVSFDRTASFLVRRGDRPFVLLGEEGLRGLSGFRRMLGAAMTRNDLRRRAVRDSPRMSPFYMTGARWRSNRSNPFRGRSAISCSSTAGGVMITLRVGR
jgi:RNA 2',3'-cyclic 3'-phosphodiesterase